MDDVQKAGSAAGGKRARNNQDLPSARGDTKRSAVGFTLTGGVPQPPRMIGYRRTGAHVDITIRVEKRAFETHSQVLGACCGFFEKQPNFSAKVDLPTPSAPAFEALLEFFYTGEVTVPEHLLVPLLETAVYLRAEAAMKAALAAVSQRLKPDNCLDYLVLGKRLGYADLCRRAERLVAEHFDAVRMQSKFGELREELVVTLLSSNELAVTSEEAAFDAATKWLSAQSSPPASGALVERVLSCIRYPTMSRQFVTQSVMTHPLLQLAPKGVGLVLESYLDAHHGPSTTLSTRRTHVKPPSSLSSSSAAGKSPDGGGHQATRSPSKRRRSRDSGGEPRSSASTDPNSTSASSAPDIPDPLAGASPAGGGGAAAVAADGGKENRAAAAPAAKAKAVPAPIGSGRNQPFKRPTPGSVSKATALAAAGPPPGYLGMNRAHMLALQAGAAKGKEREL